MRITLNKVAMTLLAAALLSLVPPPPLRLQLESAQEEKFPEARTVRSYTGAIRIELRLVTAGLSLFGAAGDPLAQDPLRQEDFLAPDLSLALGPRWTLRAQLAKALRAGSDDTLALIASCAF